MSTDMKSQYSAVCSRVVPILMAVSALTAACGGSPAPTTPTPATIYRQGTIQIPQTFPLDLDAGRIQDFAGSGDVWFQAVTNDKRYLSPEYWNGAGLSFFGQTDPGKAGCAAANVGDNDVPVESLKTGVFLCARTNERRIAEIKIISPPGPSSLDASITVEYTVYAN